MSGAVELLACPFCAGPADRNRYDGTRFKCLACQADGPLADYSGTYWNTRAPDPAVAVLEAEVARLRGALQSALTFIEDLAGNDLDETAADGGVTVGMVMQQQASTVFGPRLLAALNPAPSEKEAG